ncbi:MAG: EamA family transporter [Desulfobacterales bacterium]|nr:MAG: EamA family transporter [Desulfobacterales bacterium]
MSIPAISLVILSALLHAFRNLFTKESGDKQIFLWWYSVFALVFYAPLFVYFLNREGVDDPSAYIWCAASGFIHCLYWLFLTNSYKEGDLSHVYPIMRSSPALVLLFAVLFLDEQVSAQGVVGVLLVAFGIYIINMKRWAASELWAPVRSIAHDPSTRFAFFTLLAVAVYSIVDKAAVSRIHPVLFAFYHLFFGMLYYTPYIALKKDRALVRQEWIANKKRILASGFIGIFGYTLILIAFTLGRVSYIVGLRQLSIVFAVLMGSYFLKEKQRGLRFVGALIIFSGGFLISLAK